MGYAHNAITIYVTAGEERKIHFGIGTDTATDRYLNFGVSNSVGKLRIIPTIGCLITEIDNRVLKYPIKVHTVKQLNIIRYISSVESFKIFALAESTIDIYGGF